MPKFSYIITIHNAGDHLIEVLKGVDRCKGLESKVYCVLDGCTDMSEFVVNNFDYEKLHTDDVHELRAINFALQNIPESEYYIILQDDVVLQDEKIEEKLEALFEDKTMGQIGIIGMRHGSDLEEDWKTNGKSKSEKNLIQSLVNTLIPGIEELKEGAVAIRETVYKSPIAISRELYEEISGYDERFAPFQHEDTEFCMRARKAGFLCAVFALKVYQPREWSGTAKDTKLDMNKIQMDHMNLLREIHA